MYNGLPPAPKTTKTQSDEIALEDAWHALGNRRHHTAALSADDAANLDAEWRATGTKVARERQRAEADLDAGLTAEQRLEKKWRTEQAAAEQKRQAKATSDRLDRELGEMIGASLARSRR
jgi:hypothetical protein